jgi:predicted dehydrogenase
MAADGTEMQQVGIGVIATAAIAKKNCRGITKTRNNVVVVAVGSRDLRKAQAFIEEMGMPHATAYGSYDDVLNDPKVHAVYIPLPTGLHLEWVRKAAAKGKHILVEKPIALTAEDTDHIASACAESGVQLMDGTMWMHNPRTKLMSDKIDKRLEPNGIGPLKAITSTFCFCGDAGFLANDIRTKKGLDQLGALGDVGWYCIRAALWAYTFEKPVSVSAHAGPLYNSEGVLLHVGATLVWADGRRANFQCGFDQALTQYLEVAGTQGTVRLDDFVVPYQEDKNAFLVTQRHGFGKMDTCVLTETEEHICNMEVPQETCMWETFADCVRSVQQGGKPVQYWSDIAVITQKVVCAIEQSAADGCKTVVLKW